MAVAQPFWASLVLVCSLQFLAGASASAQAPDAEPTDPPADVQAAYRAVVAQAVVEFDARRFAEARSLFLRAHELWPSARTLRTLGMTAFELRLYPRALEELQAAIDDPRRALPDDQRSRVLALIEQTRAFVGRYRVQLSPAEAELLVDGTPQPASPGAIVLAVGDHALLVRAPGYGELRLSLVVQGREDQQLALSLAPLAASPQPTATPAPATTARRPLQPARHSRTGAAPAQPPSPDRTAALSAFGVGAAGFITSAVFAGLALHDKSELDATKCPDQRCPAQYTEQREEMERFAHFATAGFVVGALGAAIGSYLWFSGEPAAAAADEPEAARVKLSIGVASAVVSGRY